MHHPDFSDAQPTRLGSILRAAILIGLFTAAALLSACGGEYLEEQDGPPYIPPGYVYVPTPSKLECAPVCPQYQQPATVPTEKAAALTGARQ